MGFNSAFKGLNWRIDRPGFGKKNPEISVSLNERMAEFITPVFHIFSAGMISQTLSLIL
jgi:hypothetical protein